MLVLRGQVYLASSIYSGSYTNAFVALSAKGRTIAECDQAGPTASLGLPALKRSCARTHVIGDQLQKFWGHDAIW